jgi:hypothetical protein
MIKLILKKYVLIGVLLPTVLVSFFIWFNFKQTEAFNRGVDSVVQEINKKTNFEIKKQEKRNFVLLEEDYKDIIKTEVIKKETEIKIVEIIKYVDKPIEIPTNCTKLVDDSIWMLSETTDLIIKAQGSRD